MGFASKLDLFYYMFDVDSDSVFCSTEGISKYFIVISLLFQIKIAKGWFTSLLVAFPNENNDIILVALNVS